MLLLALACRPPDAERFLAWVHHPEGYAIEGRSVDDLYDPYRMEGALGTIRYGGSLRDGRYAGGRALAVDYRVYDGVAVPNDPDGVLLYSFYGNLSDVGGWVAAQGVPVEEIFPIDMGWNLAANFAIELSLADNAAYATGQNAFLLLADGDGEDVPLVANKGVVAHEFGHAVFHLLTAGGPYKPSVVTDPGGVAAQWQASLHEAFADTLATLFTDDPRFIDASLAQASRDVEGGQVMHSELEPTGDDLLALLYDPYPLGTVFASTFWDIRLESDDPEGTFQLLLATVAAWSPDASTFEGRSFLDALVGVSEDPKTTCAIVERRFGGWYVPPACP